MPRNRQSALSAIACLAVVGFTLASCRDDRTPPAGVEPADGSGPLNSQTVPFNSAGQCMVDDVNTFGGGPTNCTANDISIAKAYPTSGQLLTCTPNTSVTVDLTAELQATSNAERQDIGIWIANDGGNGKTGACSHYNVPPGTGNTVNGDGDQCAGMSSAPTPNATLSLGSVTLQCNNIITIGGQTYLHVGSCLAWTVPGQDGVCSDDRDGNGTPSEPSDFRAATIPGTPAKCNCEGFNIPVQIVSQLTIVKDAIPDAALDFAYAATGAGMSAFSLDDDADPALSNTRTFTGLVNDPAITRTVTETVPSNWKVTNIACTGATQSIVTIGSDADFDAGDASVSVVLKAGESVSCTFTNTKQATIKIVKNTVPDGAQDFSYTQNIDGSGAFSLDDDADGTLSSEKTFTNVDPSTTGYTVTENAATGYDLTALSCDDPVAGNASTTDLAGRTATIRVDPGETVTCTYTNTGRGSVIIRKNTVPDGGRDFSYTQTLDGSGGFSLDDDGDGTLSNEKTFANVAPSTTGYTVTEAAATGYALTALVCDDPIAGNASTVDLATRTATIRVDAGETVTCTFTNTANATFDVAKVTLGGTGSFSYTTSGTGPSQFTSFASLITLAANVAVSASFSLSGAELDGAKFVTELSLAGWTLTAINCQANGATILIGTGQGGSFSQGATAGFDAGDNTIQVTFAPGSSPSCTFVNTIATIGRITPTQTACIDFKTAPNDAANTLEFINYSPRTGTINQVDPGVFFYYSQITHTGGNLTITTDQTVSPAFKEFLVHQYPSTSQVKLYDANCNVIGTATITFLDGGTAVQISAANLPAGTYYLGIKYDPKTVVGETVSGGSYVYTFTTSVNGGAAINSDNLTLRPKQ